MPAIGHLDQGEVGHQLIQPFEIFGWQGEIVHRPDYQRGDGKLGQRRGGVQPEGSVKGASIGGTSIGLAR